MGWETNLAMRIKNRKQLERLLGHSMNPITWAAILSDITQRCREIDCYTSKLEREHRKQAEQIIRLKEKVRYVETLNRR